MRCDGSRARQSTSHLSDHYGTAADSLVHRLQPPKVLGLGAVEAQVRLCLRV
jgi:hypothetical protein